MFCCVNSSTSLATFPFSRSCLSLLLMFVCERVHVHLHVCVRECVFVCVCVHVHVFTSTCACVQVCVPVCVYMLVQMGWDAYVLYLAHFTSTLHVLFQSLA